MAKTKLLNKLKVAGNRCPDKTCRKFAPHLLGYHGCYKVSTYIRNDKNRRPFKSLYSQQCFSNPSTA